MISRRRFLAGGTALAGTGLGLLWLREGVAPPPPPAGTGSSGGLQLDSGLGDGFDQVLVSLVGTDPLGAAWVAGEGVEQPGPVIEALAVSLDAPGAAEAAGPGDWAARLSALVREDFQRGRTCQVEGWLLSQTECRLVGLRHLLARADAGNAALIAAETREQTVADYPEGEIAPLAKWGPQKTRVGEKFNVQLDGHSGLWFQFSGAPAHARIAIDGELVKTSVSPEVVTSGLFGEMQERILSTPGRYPIALVDPVRRVRQPVGHLEVLPRKPAAGIGSGGFCDIEKWGPQKTRVGLAKNEQAGGAMGVWVKSDCMPPDTRLMVGDDMVKSGVRKFGLAGSVPAVFLETPGELELQLFSPSTGQRQPLGVLLIEP